MTITRECPICHHATTVDAEPCEECKGLGATVVLRQDLFRPERELFETCPTCKGSGIKDFVINHPQH
jgi:DnaJ-class molecular chaperone